MPTPTERVQVVKRESAALGGDAADERDYLDTIDPSEDVIEAAGYAVQDPSNRDMNVLLWRDGNDLYFKDPTTGTRTLSQLGASSGITEATHRTLRQLIHFIDNGPAEGFASGAYRETLPAADPFPTSVTWYVDSSKADKIVEKTLAYTGAFPTTITWRVYDTDGSTVLATVSDAITYSGAFETSRTRTIS